MTIKLIPPFGSCKIDATLPSYESDSTVNYIFTQHCTDDRVRPVVIDGVPYYAVVTMVIP